MTPVSHVLTSSAAAGVCYYLFPSWQAPLSCFLVGVFMDVDHFLDFYLEQGVSLDIKKFVRYCYENLYRKNILFLHSNELLLVFPPLFYYYGWNPWVAGILIGFSLHMVLDHIFNEPRSMFSYFFIYRYLQQFKMGKIFYLRGEKR